MPTPLAYKGLLYVLATPACSTRIRIETGDEIYRQRLTHPGSGFSASPIAADGKIYLANEDGDMLVVAAGPDFKTIATNTMGEFLMATPALSEGVMYVKSASTLWAIGRK
jgi:outer membrane protein assembly factor BamB